MPRLLLVARNPTLVFGLGSASDDIIEVRPSLVGRLAVVPKMADVIVIEQELPAEALVTLDLLRAGGLDAPALLVASARTQWSDFDPTIRTAVAVLDLPITQERLGRSIYAASGLAEARVDLWPEASEERPRREEASEPSEADVVAPAEEDPPAALATEVVPDLPADAPAGSKSRRFGRKTKVALAVADAGLAGDGADPVESADAGPDAEEAPAAGVGPQPEGTRLAEEARPVEAAAPLEEAPLSEEMRLAHDAEVALIAEETRLAEDARIAREGQAALLAQETADAEPPEEATDEPAEGSTDGPAEASTDGPAEASTDEPAEGSEQESRNAHDSRFYAEMASLVVASSEILADQPVEDDPAPPEPGVEDETPIVDLSRVFADPARVPTVDLLPAEAAHATEPEATEHLEVLDLRDPSPEDLESASALVRALLARSQEIYGVSEVGALVVSDALARTGATAGVLLLPDGDTWRVAAGEGLRRLEHRRGLAADSWLVTTVASRSKGVIIERGDDARRLLADAPLAAHKHLVAAPVPSVAGILLIARDADPGFAERDLLSLARLAEASTAILACALEARQLARLLAGIRDQDDATATDRIDHES